MQMAGSSEEQKLQEQLKLSWMDELDQVDLKRISEGHFDCIGVKPRVDTNRPQTKQEKLIELKKAIVEANMKRAVRKGIRVKDKKKKVYQKIVRMDTNLSLARKNTTLSFNESRSRDLMNQTVRI